MIIPEPQKQLMVSRALLISAARFSELKSLSNKVCKAEFALDNVNYQAGFQLRDDLEEQLFDTHRLYFNREIRPVIEDAFDAIDDVIGLVYLDLAGYQLNSMQKDEDGDYVYFMPCITHQLVFEALLEHCERKEGLDTASTILALMIFRDATARRLWDPRFDLDRLSQVYSSYPHTWLALAIKEKYSNWRSMMKLMHSLAVHEQNEDEAKEKAKADPNVPEWEIGDPHRDIGL